ncbi:MAG: chromosomal replication initiator protein DnaA, partial [Ignavibacteriales bacterium]|nr:chromosomal replication initiator protein DnaA [Ignavibacteriales bacterium]
RAVIESAAPSLESNLNPNLTFERYVKGESNQLAFAAASAVAKKPGGTSFNPLFIYGGVGLGKTHLLQAVGDEARRRDERLRARYVSANEFTMDFVNAIQSNQANDFASFYKSVDLLLIDDIQFLTGRERTQELFFNIFNSLHQSGKQIVMTSDKPPKDLDGMDERLVSRFHWGLTADIQPPDFETRMAIVNKKLEEYGAAAPSDVVEYVASRVDSNIRELEGCLVKIVANASLAGKPIDVNAAKLAVGEVMAREKPRLTVERITEIVCEAFDVEVKDARSKSRKKAIVEARRGAMYFARMFSNGSMKSIGKYFGGRDHSTVVHALKAVDAAVDNDERFRRTIDEIKKKIETERR